MAMIVSDSAAPEQPLRACRHKQGYVSEGEARDIARRQSQQCGYRLRPYRCREEGCDLWHLTAMKHHRRRYRVFAPRPAESE